MVETWRSAGEAMLQRELEVEKREGVEHYVTGQAKAEVVDEEEDGSIGAFYGFCDQMGGAVLMVLIKPLDGPWEPVLARRSGYFTGPSPMAIPPCFEPNDAMLAKLDVAEKEWRAASE